MDATEAPTLQDLHVAGVAQKAGRPFLIALNKWDLIAEEGTAAKELVEKVRGRMRFATYAPIATVSARTGARVDKLFGQLAAIREQSGREISTGRLNHWLQRSAAAHRPPARRGGKELKLSYAVQQGIHPPSFVIFTNASEPPHFSYRRYLENSLRERFGLDLTPVVIAYREKPRRARGSATPPRRPRKQSV
jgi:GTP-binding protein